MFHREDQIAFDAGEGWQQMIQDLLSGHAELAPTGADFQPTHLVAVIALGKILRAEADDVTIVGEFHITLAAGFCGSALEVFEARLGGLAVHDHDRRHGGAVRREAVLPSLTVVRFGNNLSLRIAIEQYVHGHLPGLIRRDEFYGFTTIRG